MTLATATAALSQGRTPPTLRRRTLETSDGRAAKRGSQWVETFTKAPQTNHNPAHDTKRFNLKFDFFFRLFTLPSRPFQNLIPWPFSYLGRHSPFMVPVQSIVYRPARMLAAVVFIL